MEEAGVPRSLQRKFVRSLLWMMAGLCLAGCLNPARQQVPTRTAAPVEKAWREELVPGRQADRALGFLLTEGFECQVTRDEKGRVERILATQNAPAGGRPRQIDLAIRENKIDRVEFLPISSSQ